MPAHETTNWIAVGGTLLLVSALLLVSRALAKQSASHERIVASFAGGVSLAFVLLDLFVEIAQGAAHELYDVFRAGSEPLHTIAILLLAGTVAAFVANVYQARHEDSWRTYAIAIAPPLVYSALVGAALVEELHESPRAFAVFWLAMALHLGVSEHRLRLAFPKEHRGLLRATTSAAPIVGATVWSVATPSPAVFHVVLTLVAGATIFSIFREEIPSARDVRVRAFLAGVVLFGALVQVRWWL